MPNRTLRSLAVLGLVALPLAAQTPADLPTRLRDAAAADETAYGLARSLTTEVGPRLAGSEGDRRAVEWGLREMRRLGFANVRADEVTVPHWERGEAAARIVAPWPQPLHLTALGGSVATPEEGIVAEVVEVGSVADLEALPDEAVAGKIVFLNQRMERRRDGSGYGETVGIRSRGPAVAGRKGAVAAVIRSVATGDHRFPHTGGTRYADDAPKVPAAALAVPDADVLERQIASGEPVRMSLRMTPRTLPDATSANVIGEIPGATKPEEIVLLGCHLDSWDLGTGAIDDAAGCATVMGAAKLIGELPERPARTVRVVLFANEEFGLSGARAYAERHAEEVPRHVLGLEADFGAGAVWRASTWVNPEATGFQAALAAALAPFDVVFAGNVGGGGADLIPLAASRVPVMSLNEDGTHYFDYHHTADDTFDKIDPEDLAHNVGAYATAAWVAATTGEELRPAPERD